MKRWTFYTKPIATVTLALGLIVSLTHCSELPDAEIESAPSLRAVSTTSTTRALDDLIGVEAVSIQPLARAGFPDGIDKLLRIRLEGSGETMESNVEDAADVLISELTFEPGGFVGWHTHPGPVIVAVASGALTVVNEIDCVQRVYEAGQSFVDPGQGNVHVAFNDQEEEAHIYATFLDVPPGDGPTILLDEPGNCPGDLVRSE